MGVPGPLWFGPERGGAAPSSNDDLSAHVPLCDSPLMTTTVDQKHRAVKTVSRKAPLGSALGHSFGFRRLLAIHRS
ncbi:hypothetical protein SBV1_2240007 [Verrucomicrobia bacterium]|nr:hypothetical protein SBV1_2240007 [Verrucomicrobiota bacterium]